MTKDKLEQIEEPKIHEHNQRILFLNHTFGMRSYKLSTRSAPYLRASDKSLGIPPRFKGPRVAKVYGRECFLDFYYVIDLPTGEWYTFPPSELTVVNNEVVNGAVPAIDYLIRHHSITNPLVVKVRNGQRLRRLHIWFESTKGNELQFYFRDGIIKKEVV